MYSFYGSCTVRGMGGRIIYINDVTLSWCHLLKGLFFSHGGHLVMVGHWWLVVSSWQLVAQSLSLMVGSCGDGGGLGGGDEGRFGAAVITGKL